MESVVVNIEVSDAPSEFLPYGAIQLLLQSKTGYSPDPYRPVIQLKPNRKGEMHWTGDAVYHHGDGRRFFYLAWLYQRGNEWVMFRRIKLYLDQINALGESSETTVTISGVGKDLAPACSTAKVL